MPNGVRMDKKVLLVTVGTVFVGLFFSFVSAISLYHSEKIAIEYEIQKDVGNTALSLSRELNISVELLYALRNQLTVLDDINQQHFSQFAQVAMSRHKNIQAMEWAQLITQEQKTEFESQIGQLSIVEQNKNGDLVNVSKRDRYMPVRYVYPYPSNQPVLGFDLASNLEIKKALEMSWYRGVPIATPSFRFKQELASPIGFILLLPVFTGDPETNAQRKQALRGFLLVRFDVKDIFEQAIKNTVKESINLELIDKGLNPKDKVIYRNLVHFSGPVVSSFTFTSEPIFFAGRTWELRGIPSAHYVHSRLSQIPYIIFFVGMIIFCLLAYLLYILQHRALIIQQHVDAKTRQLRSANKKLEQMSKSDGLTGFHNRDYFEECMEAEVKRAHRDDLPISLLLLTIDDISLYSEQNGRVAGDRLIRMVGNAISDVLKRPGDLLARYDGETFAVLLPNTKDGAPIANLCTVAIAELKLPFYSSLNSERVSISIGGITVQEGPDLSGARLVDYARKALNQAHRAGTNQSHWLYLP